MGFRLLGMHECFCDNQEETEQGFWNEVKGQFTIGCPLGRTGTIVDETGGCVPAVPV